MRKSTRRDFRQRRRAGNADDDEEKRRKREKRYAKLGGEGEDEKSKVEKEIERRLSEKRRDQLPDFSNNAANNDVKAHEKETQSEEEVRRERGGSEEALPGTPTTLEKRRRREAFEGNASASRAIGTIEVGPFNVPNPGGGQDLINDVVTFVPGRRYALIGRNDGEKHVIDAGFEATNDKVGFRDVFVHYVNQEVTLNEEQEEWLPVDVALHADVQRLLLEELKG